LRATRTFEPSPDQVIEVRRFVAAALSAWGVEGADVPLLVSELATNAVLHARSEFTVGVTVEGYRVRVEVVDGNSRLPSFATVGPEAYSGRGLMLVQGLSSAWGVDAHASDGKTIWFEVDRVPAGCA
jgi:anti-sigma regulatory factor (Ser/Thr protein kinase)